MVQCSFKAFVICLALASASGCTDGGPDPLTGRYVLRTIDGTQLPFTQQTDPSAASVILSGSIDLARGGTFASSYTYTWTIGNEQPKTLTVDVAGTWVHTAVGVELRSSENSPPTIATIQGRRLTIAEPVPWVYEKP